MLVKLIVVIVILFVFFKLLKFIGKKIIFILILIGFAILAFSQEPSKNIKGFNTELISSTSIDNWIAYNFNEEVAEIPLTDVLYYNFIDDKKNIMTYNFNGDFNFTIEITWTPHTIQMKIIDLENTIDGNILKNKITSTYFKSFSNLKEISYIN